MKFSIVAMSFVLSITLGAALPVMSPARDLAAQQERRDAAKAAIPVPWAKREADAAKAAIPVPWAKRDAEAAKAAIPVPWAKRDAEAAKAAIPVPCTL
ncbi:hypothetical protein M7I_0931 [Glarea lozoyensis 74030]|uniref:Uncharacterized protein n=1 Tax=Glarea lozoyensis (strain ATCC 74030 / MF5533) TaxID=1104152 RepID=H0EEQ1_GLAL7|nr:hypothetical protein M7I_0931 [Glarea lozoyensis 74030]